MAPASRTEPRAAQEDEMNPPEGRRRRSPRKQVFPTPAEREDSPLREYFPTHLLDYPAIFEQCVKCASARLYGMESWLDHLGAFHPIPPLWPSTMIRDGIINSDKPYTSLVSPTNRCDDAKIPRPMNKYFVSYFLSLSTIRLINIWNMSCIS